MTKRGRRDLTRAERSLWNQVARTVAPMPGKAISEPELKGDAGPDRALPAPPPDDGRRAAPWPTPPRSSPLEAGDPRSARRVARGRMAIDAVLDLHGLRQSEADRATTAFLSRSLSRGHRVVLVITGKGSRDSEGGQGRGVLRKRFLQGIEAGLYGPQIASVRPAHQKHGGAGAFYVFLKTGQKRKTASNTVTKASLRNAMRPPQ